jgi:CRISPR/Cas system Type II protein with McrA/HNH and RuvC-like nuclease domain
MERREKFKILHRDNFTCRYCGARPGSENLEVDHLIPRSKGGSDKPPNLVTACRTCNGRKSDTIVFPADMIERDDTDEGWKIHKSFGVWGVKFTDTHIVIEDDRGWYFEARRLNDENFVKRHLWTKVECAWGQQKASDFLDCYDYMMRMMRVDWA